MALIRAKLHNRHGATMMMALLLLLVATVVSVIIIASATTAMRRISSDHAQQQAWLTVSSAAQMLRDGIEDDSILMTTIKVTTEQQTDTTESLDVTGDFAELLRPALQYLEANKAQDHYETALTLSAGELDPVSVHFYLFRDVADEQSSGYTIKAFFSMPDAKYDCRMTLEIASTAEVETSGSTEISSDDKLVSTTVTQKTITWKTGTITRGAAE